MSPRIMLLWVSKIRSIPQESCMKEIWQGAVLYLGLALPRAANVVRRVSSSEPRGTLSERNIQYERAISRGKLLGFNLHQLARVEIECLD
jgi:uncharacterized protein (DUF1499 family)